MNNLYIDKELFYDLDDITKELSDDDKNFTLLAMLAVMTIANKFAPCTYTSLDMIFITMTQNVEFKPTAKVKKGIIDGINRLHESELIELSEPLDGSAKQVVSVKTDNLNHIEKKSFFQISRKELAAIMTSKTPQHLIKCFCNMSARWNMDAYVAFDENDFNVEDYHNMDFQLCKTLGCYPQREEFINSWVSIPVKGKHQVIQCSEPWDVTERAITGYINELIELGLISRIITYGVSNTDCKKRAYYCRPQHEQLLTDVLTVIKEQKKFIKMQQLKSQEQEEVKEEVPVEKVSFKDVANDKKEPVSKRPISKRHGW
jgi:hypothetical protein